MWESMYYPGPWNAPPAAMETGYEDPEDIGYTTGVEVPCPACENNVWLYALGGALVGFLLAGAGKRQ